jgi:prevent-host-death family protein
MKVVTVHKAKTQLSKLIEEACAGEEIIIARGKAPVVRLIPVTPLARGRSFGAMRGRAKTGPEFFEPLSAAELKAWER